MPGTIGHGFLSSRCILVKLRWNVDPEDPTSMLRLISELEGVSTLLPCFDDTEEDIAYIEAMKRKYYKTYYRMLREEKLVKHTCAVNLEALQLAMPLSRKPGAVAE